MPGYEEHLRGAARCPHLVRVRDLGVFNAHRGGLEALLASQFATGLRGLHLQDLQVPSPSARLGDFLPILRLLAGAGLRRLGLCFRGFEASEVRAFARLGLLSRLEELTLDYKGLNDTTARILSDTAALAGLRALRFRGSRVGDAGVRHLAESPHLTGLQRLSLYGARRVTDDGFAALARSPHLRNLTDLDLRYTTVTHDAVRALVESPNLPRLSRLLLVGTPAAPRDAEIDSASWHTCPPDQHTGVVWVAELRSM
jgi:hypothetical protein